MKKYEKDFIIQESVLTIETEGYSVCVFGKSENIFLNEDVKYNRLVYKKDKFYNKEDGSEERKAINKKNVILDWNKTILQKKL